MPNTSADFDSEQGVGPRVLFNGHVDPSPANAAENGVHNPFSGHNNGTFIPSLVAMDMKVGTAASAIAFTIPTNTFGLADTASVSRQHRTKRLAASTVQSTRTKSAEMHRRGKRTA